MKFAEKGGRLGTFYDTLRAVSAVYSLAAKGGGINAVRFLNSRKIHTDFVPGNIEGVKNELVFEGLTSIGTKLRDKVLKPYAGDDMARPLLVIVITDGHCLGMSPG